MSFNFGQFRRSQVENYLTAIKNYNMTVVETVSPMSASMVFADKTIQLSSDNPLISVNEKNIKKHHIIVGFSIHVVVFGSIYPKCYYNYR